MKYPTNKQIIPWNLTPERRHVYDMIYHKIILKLVRKIIEKFTIEDAFAFRLFYSNLNLYGKGKYLSWNTRKKRKLNFFISYI